MRYPKVSPAGRPRRAVAATIWVSGRYCRGERKEADMQMSALTERLPEMRQKLEEAGESLPDTEAMEIGAGAFLIGAGAISAVINVARGRRETSVWVLPAVMLSAGLALLLTGTFQRRSERIESAQQTVQAELDALGPIARAQVLKAVAQEQLERYVPEGDGE